MSRTTDWIFFVLTFTSTACVTRSVGGDDGGSGGDVGSSGGARAPFTNGVSTLAGWADAGDVDGDRDINLFSNPVNVARAANGVVYVADHDNGTLRAVDESGDATTILVNRYFARPYGMAFAPDGTLYVSTDTAPDGNDTATTGTIWAVDVGAHTAAPVAVAIGRPRGLVVLADGRLAVTDAAHQVIETIDPQSGAVAILAGTWDAAGFIEGVGAAARFSAPYGLVQRADGALVVCDQLNDQLRLVTLDGTVTTLTGTIAGFADGSPADAKFASPQGIAIAANGDLFVTDLDNYRVRRITATTVDTIAGDGKPGYIDSDQRGSAELYGLEGIAVSPDGATIYVADGNRGDDVPFNRVREIDVVP